MAGKILLASHDTIGAVAAEQAALARCRHIGASLHMLVVVPDFWKGMRGDDWLNNAATQIRFGNYVENQLQREIVEHVTRVAAEAEQAGVPFTSEARLGKPADCLVAVFHDDDYQHVFVGSPRPKGTPGYRSRMHLDTLARGLNAPLTIVPYPEA